MIDSKTQTFNSNLKLLAILLFVVSLPFSRAWNSVATVLLTITWLFESPLRTKWERMKETPAVVFFIMPYLLYLIGLSYTEDLNQGLAQIERKLGLFVFPIIFCSSDPLEKSQIRIVFKAFILACSVATLICFVYAVYRNYQEGDSLSYFNYWYFIHYFFAEPIKLHPTYFAMYLAFSCYLVVWLEWDSTKFENGISKWTILFLIFSFTMVVLLSSRTQLFLLLSIGMVFTLYYCFIKKILVYGLLLICFVSILGITLIVINPVSRERFYKSILPNSHYSENEYGEGGLSLRTYNWKYTMETIWNDPIMGTGTGDAQNKLQLTYVRNNFKIGYENTLNPHNQFLSTALEIGIVGLLSLLAYIFWPTYMAVKSRSWLFLVFLITFSLSCLTESMLELNKGIMFYSFFNSILVFHLVKSK